MTIATPMMNATTGLPPSVCVSLDPSSIARGSLSSARGAKRALGRRACIASEDVDDKGGDEEKKEVVEDGGKEGRSRIALVAQSGKPIDPPHSRASQTT